MCFKQNCIKMKHWSENETADSRLVMMYFLFETKPELLYFSPEAYFLLIIFLQYDFT